MSQDSVTVRQQAQYRDPETLAAEWNSAIIKFNIYTCSFPPVTCQKVFCEKRLQLNLIIMFEILPKMRMDIFLGIDLPRVGVQQQLIGSKWGIESTYQIWILSNPLHIYLGSDFDNFVLQKFKTM